MAHIVYITNGMASTLHSGLELSRRLTAAGHRITFLSDAKVEDQITAAGHEFHRLTAPEALQKELKKNKPNKGKRQTLRGRFRWHRYQRRIRHQSLHHTEVEDHLAALAPDLLIIDAEMHVAIIAASQLKIPILLTIVWFSIFHQPGLPPLHTPLAPTDNPAEDKRRFEDAWTQCIREARAFDHDSKNSPEGKERQANPIAYSSVFRDDLIAFARARNIRLNEMIDRSQWLRPHTYRDFPVLSFNVEALEFPHDNHPLLHYVGPMIDVNRSELERHPKDHARWEAFLKQRPPENFPLVYASLGTFWAADQNFLKTILQVFARHPEWSLVLGLGGTLKPADLAPTPENTLVLEWAPQLKVLQHAAAAITHGGITTINECLRLGVPPIVYSTHHVDQDGCAARVAFHKVGIAAEKNEASPTQLEEDILEILTNSALRENVQTMKQKIIATEISHTALKVIEKRLPPT